MGALERNAKDVLKRFDKNGDGVLDRREAEQFFIEYVA